MEIAIAASGYACSASICLIGVVVLWAYLSDAQERRHYQDRVQRRELRPCKKFAEITPRRVQDR